MSPSLPWNKAQRILCVRLDNMGDVLMTTPALRALKQSRADRHLTLWTSSSGAVLGPYLPDVDQVLSFEAPWVKNDADDVQADLHMVKVLRAQAFDAAVIFTVYSQSALPAALMCRLAGIPRVLAHCRENPYHLVSDWVRESEPPCVRHEVQRQLDLVSTIGATNPDPVLRFALRDADRISLFQKLAAYHLTRGTPWVVVHCGASAASRRYPAPLFARAIRQLGPGVGAIVLTGDATERDLTRDVAQWCEAKVPIVNVAGLLTLGELACLIADARVLVSNNSGPVHIAAAVGTPVVDLYALTNPQHAPWRVPHRLLFQDVPCKYCYRSVCPERHHRCLRGVRPIQVCQAVHELLGLATRCATLPRKLPVPSSRSPATLGAEQHQQAMEGAPC